jgi:hypothetical protein
MDLGDLRGALVVGARDGHGIAIVSAISRRPVALVVNEPANLAPPARRRHRTLDFRGLDVFTRFLRHAGEDASFAEALVAGGRGEGWSRAPRLRGAITHRDRVRA